MVVLLEVVVQPGAISMDADRILVSAQILRSLEEALVERPLQRPLLLAKPATSVDVSSE